MADIQQLLGHASTQNTERYVGDQGAALVPLIRPKK
jgi:hypothetical protein